MKWSKAIEMIEKALADGKCVEIEYHRKWNRNSNEVRWSTVESVECYKWKGEILKAVNVPYNIIEEGNWIINSVNVDDPEEIHDLNMQIADEEVKMLEAEGIIKVEEA